AAVRVLRYTGHQVEDQAELLMVAAQDEHGRVRLEAIVAASWLDQEEGLPILNEARKYPLDKWMKEPFKAAVAHIQGQPYHNKEQEKKEEIETSLEGEAKKLLLKVKVFISGMDFAGHAISPTGKVRLVSPHWLAQNGLPDLRIGLLELF